jgi:CheY-like chemotaxis protein
MSAKVLIVDDDRTITKLIELQLSRVSSYEVAVAYDGESALELVRQWTPDLVLLDILMPGMDGQETCRRMREIDAMTPVPIIMLTALSDIDNKRQAFGAGADDYITKPYNPEDLALRVGAHLRRAGRLAQIREAGRVKEESVLLPHRITGGMGLWMAEEFSAGDSPVVSVVIPTLNEADCLPHVLPRIPGWINEVILVDGGSTDGTVAVARKILPDIRVVMQKKRGKGDALRCGFDAARGDIVVMLDADGSTDPAEIPFFVGALLTGADYAKGTRFVHGGGTVDMPFVRVLGNWLFVTAVRVLFGGTYSDLCYGYNAFWKNALSRLELDADGFEIETEMNVRALTAGLKVVEVPSFEAERVDGVAKLNPIQDGWRILLRIFREYFVYRFGRGQMRRAGRNNREQCTSSGAEDSPAS